MQSLKKLILGPDNTLLHGDEQLGSFCIICLPAFHQLQVLDLSHFYCNSDVTDKCLAVLAKNCPDLRYVSK